MPDYAEGAAGGAGTSADTAGAPMVARACVASTTTGSGTGGGANSKFGAVTWNKVATAYTNWWCSNGLYKKVTGTGSGDGELNIT